MSESVIASIVANASAAPLVNARNTKHVNAQVKPSNLLSAEVIPYTSFEVALFIACNELERAHWETDNKRAWIAELVRAHFGDTMPTFKEYRAMQEAMHLQSIEAGYTGQAMRKHVAAAVKAAYGALPASDSPAAIAKRAQRPGKAEKVASADTLPESDDRGPAERRPSEAETIESFIARVGIAATLDALVRILEVEDATVGEAAVLQSVKEHLKAA